MTGIPVTGNQEDGFGRECGDMGTITIKASGPCVDNRSISLRLHAGNN